MGPDIQATYTDLRWSLVKGLLIDAVLIWISWFAIAEVGAAMLDYSVAADESDVEQAIFFWLGLFVWWTGYFWIFQDALRTTPGLAAYRLRVNHLGGRVSVIRRLVAALVVCIETFPIPLVAAMSLIRHPKNARISDRLKNTSVIQSNK